MEVILYEVDRDGFHFVSGVCVCGWVDSGEGDCIKIPSHRITYSSCYTNIKVHQIECEIYVLHLPVCPAS